MPDDNVRPFERALRLLAQHLGEVEKDKPRDYSEAYRFIRGAVRSLGVRLETGEPLTVRELVNFAGGTIVLLRAALEIELKGESLPNADGHQGAPPNAPSYPPIMQRQHFGSPSHQITFCAHPAGCKAFCSGLAQTWYCPLRF